jgi:hypothetical protein
LAEELLGLAMLLASTWKCVTLNGIRNAGATVVCVVFAVAAIHAGAGMEAAKNDCSYNQPHAVLQPWLSVPHNTMGLVN